MSEARRRPSLADDNHNTKVCVFAQTRGISDEAKGLSISVESIVIRKRGLLMAWDCGKIKPMRGWRSFL
jgi:hypothetical protein